MAKNISACNAGDVGLILGLGKSPLRRNGNPLQYSCLGNSMDRGAWWATAQGVAKILGFQGGVVIKESTCNAGDAQEMLVQSLGLKDPLV